MFEAIASILQLLFSADARAAKRRERIVEATRLVGTELENLANLFSFVLEATELDGLIRSDKLHELHALRVRNWNRWVSILGSGAYDLLTQQDRDEIGSLIGVASAAPGDYIAEIFVIQKAVSEARISPQIRAQLAGSIARLRNKAAQLRLAV